MLFTECSGQMAVFCREMSLVKVSESRNVRGRLYFILSLAEVFAETFQKTTQFEFKVTENTRGQEVR